MNRRKRLIEIDSPNEEELEALIKFSTISVTEYSHKKDIHGRRNNRTEDGRTKSMVRNRACSPPSKRHD
jgi:hypothetical protein